MREPVSEAALLDHLKATLRMGGAPLPGRMAGAIKRARENFERMTGRTILPTTYRQNLYTLAAPITLMRCEVLDVLGVKYWNSEGRLTDLDYEADIDITATVRPRSYPRLDRTHCPKGYVDFVAGYPDLDSVPQQIIGALVLLAAHYVCHPDDKAAPDPFLGAVKTTIRDYRTALVGSWEEL